MSMRQNNLDAAKITMYGKKGYAGYMKEVAELAKEMHEEFLNDEDRYRTLAAEDENGVTAESIFDAVYEDYDEDDKAGYQKEDVKGCFLTIFKEHLDGGS